MNGRVSVALIVFCTLPFFWLASEQHYQSCVGTANARYPAGIGAVMESVPSGGIPGMDAKDYAPVSGASDINQKKRAAALNKCSLLPV